MTRSRDIADQQDNLGGAVAPYVSGKNAIINGGFDFWARGTSISVPAAAGFTYTTDRFGASTGSNQAITISRQSVSDSTNLPDIQYCARVQRNSGQTGTGSYFFDTPIETANSIPLIGKTITLSFYARGGASFVSAGDSFAGQIIAAAGTDQNPGNWTTPVLAAQRTATLTTTWQRFTVSTTVTSSYSQLFLRFNHTPVGTAGASDYYEITGVQLELGSQATPFSRAGGSIGGELALCQRYYWRTLGQVYTPFCQGMSTLTTGATLYAQHPVPMRIPPSSVEFSNLELSDLYAYGLAVSVVAIDSGSNGTNVSRINVTNASGATAFRPAFLRSANSISGYLGFSAEL